jgi:RNA polymerase sigma-70 factor (family 1)
MAYPDLKPTLSRIVNGDEIAFREIFDLFSPKVYGFAMKLTHSAALSEEIVQDVFVKIWVGRESLENVNYFPSYLYTITRNHTFNILKKLAVEERIKKILIRDLAEEQDESQENTLYQEHHHLLVNAVSQLPPQQRLVYSLCHQQGLKYEEVAEQLNISRLTVKTHMQKALRTIRSHFKSTLTLIFILSGL